MMVEMAPSVMIPTAAGIRGRAVSQPGLEEVAVVEVAEGEIADRVDHERRGQDGDGPTDCGIERTPQQADDDGRSDKDLQDGHDSALGRVASRDVGPGALSGVAISDQ